MTERERMLAGKIYDPADSKLAAERAAAHAICMEYNMTPETDEEKRRELTDRLIPRHGKNLFLQGPIQVDYGKYTFFGDNCYANFNLVILDTCPVTIGDNVFIGPNVSLLTPIHPLRYQERNMYIHPQKGYLTDREYAAPITIGSNVWLAGNVTVTGGVTIGSGSVIGAGSVVTRSIPENSLAFGNPCRVHRQITEADSIQLKSELL